MGSVRRHPLGRVSIPGSKLSEGIIEVEGRQEQMQAVSVSELVGKQASEDEIYERFLVSIRLNFVDVAVPTPAVFVTDATGLFDAFLANLPADRRQHYTCNACRRFVDRFGGLVRIDDDGSIVPAMWNRADAPEFFRNSVSDLARLVQRAKVTGVHISDEGTYGLPSNKSKVAPYEWNHMSVVLPTRLIYRSTALKTADQRAAELLEEYRMLQRGLSEFPIDIVRQAHALLTSGNLYRSEKCIGVAKWLLDLHEKREASKSSSWRDNLTWLAVATAPTGFCHVRSSMIGTLLEDVQAGMRFAQIKRRFDEKMNPLQYQRPQAAPSAGNIAQAEKVVRELQAAGALDRRFAKLEDIQCVWKPEPAKEQPAKPGVFGHLRTKEEQMKRRTIELTQPAVTMTWEKFARTILPEATAIDMLIPSGHANFSALVTSTNPETPPILQWDREDKRNHVSWYLYSGGSPASQWNLRAGAYVKVTGIALQPSMWDPERDYSHQGKSVFFLLEGAKDSGYRSGAAFFPETLRSEFHPVRSTMEAYAQRAILAGKDEATACGVKAEEGKRWSYTFRVMNKAGQRLTYTLDRWD
jgi:hypothetical protein